MKNSKHVLIYEVVLLLITLIIGYIYGLNNFYDLSDYLDDLVLNNNLYIDHLLTLFIIFFSTISLLGLFVSSIIMGIEGVSIGYTLALFFTNFKIKGLLYGVITIFINKVFYIIILGYLFYISYKYIKNILKNIVGLKQDYCISLFKPLIEKYILVVVILMLYDTFIYFCGNKLLNYLTFLL